MARVWFDVVSKSDAKALVKWWNWGGSATTHYYFKRSETNPRFYAVIQEHSK